MDKGRMNGKDIRSCPSIIELINCEKPAGNAGRTLRHLLNGSRRKAIVPLDMFLHTWFGSLHLAWPQSKWPKLEICKDTMSKDEFVLMRGL